MALLINGKVKWWSDAKGYGFIEVAGREDVFVHHTGICMKPGQRNLIQGQSVEFELTVSPKTKKEVAKEVMVLVG